MSTKEVAAPTRWCGGDYSSSWPALVVAALLDVFGQRPVTRGRRSVCDARGSVARSTLRGGLIFQARFTVTARRRSVSRRSCSSGGGSSRCRSTRSCPTGAVVVRATARVRLTYPRSPAGVSLDVWIYFQVNPTNVGTRRQNVELDDGGTRLAADRRAP